jgi:hypothetical protein
MSNDLDRPERERYSWSQRMYQGDEMVTVEATLAVLAALEEAEGHATYLDATTFGLIRQCREDVSAKLVGPLRT